MSAAQLDQQPGIESQIARDLASRSDRRSDSPADLDRDSDETTPLPPFALKQQVAERLAAHRARRGHTMTAPATPPAVHPGQGRKAQIASAVASRYAHSQSYRSFLAAEAERSVHQAEAVAEVATINARAIAVAQQRLLADLDHWNLPPEEEMSAPALAIAATGTLGPQTTGYTVRLAESVLRSRSAAADCSPHHRHEAPDEIDLAECSLLDDEIAFRHDPVFEQAAVTPLTFAANLIEFPRQLIAARKARPRLAEGPLREDPAADPAQLRIFEVDPAQISEAPAPAEDIAPEWSSILLPSRPAVEYLASDIPAFTPTLVPQVAPIRRRLLAAGIDGCIVLATLAVAAVVFRQTAAYLNPLRAALHLAPVTAVATLAGAVLLFGLLYLVLFFTFTDRTPGMRSARIALCTFSDENPSRRAMRRRILSLAIAVLPVGLGLLWAFVDEDTLSWHDRLSHMYQRAY